MTRLSRVLALFLVGGSCAGGLRGQALVTSPMPFIGITPCRIADTRDGARPPGYGPPSLSAGVPRDFILALQCGIPDSAAAVSLNITIVNPLGLGYVLLYPQGGAQPVVSTLNYVTGLTVANAAIVPLGPGGGITVAAAVSGADLIIDVNGYYGPAAAGFTNTYLGVDSGRAAIESDFGNSAFGYGALAHTTGIGNSAFGRALAFNTTGWYNTGAGFGALSLNTTGSYNTAVGIGALANSTGNRNVALGENAGVNLETGDYNVYVANQGDLVESNTIRIGDAVHHSKTFIAGIWARTTAQGIPVFVDIYGQLGTSTSSVRYKEEIEDMAESSGGLLQLRPVTFRYKDQAGARKQFGLIAEEVAEVLPELVVCDAAGEAETVLYHELPAMLVNELQKQQKRIDELLARVSELEKEKKAAAP